MVGGGREKGGSALSGRKDGGLVAHVERQKVEAGGEVLIGLGGGLGRLGLVVWGMESLRGAIGWVR